MAHVTDVARYILTKRGQMSAMRLQKLAYYSQAWHLVFEGEPLFNAEIQAWANGPVVRALYDQHRGQFTVTASTFVGPTRDLKQNERETIDAVLDAYGDLNAQELSNLTHSELPWIEARKGLSENARSDVTINLSTMQEFYESVQRSNAL